VQCLTSPPNTAEILLSCTVAKLSNQTQPVNSGYQVKITISRDSKQFLNTISTDYNSQVKAQKYVDKAKM